MRPFRSLQPALAALLAACVLLLGWAAWSPRLHEELCAHDRTGQAQHDDDDASAHGADHACAITLFATACDAPPPPLFLPAPALNAARVGAFSELVLARTLRGPERVCGPPVRG